MYQSVFLFPTLLRVFWSLQGCNGLLFGCNGPIPPKNGALLCVIQRITRWHWCVAGLLWFIAGWLNPLARCVHANYVLQCSVAVLQYTMVGLQRTIVMIQRPELSCNRSLQVSNILLQPDAGTIFRCDDYGTPEPDQCQLATMKKQPNTLRCNETTWQDCFAISRSDKLFILAAWRWALAGIKRSIATKQRGMAVLQ